MQPQKLICKRFLNLLFSLPLLIVIIFSSCQKAELTINQISPSQTETSNKFLTLPASSDTLIKRIVAEIAQRNTRREFISSFATLNGYPLWDKVFVLKSSNKNTQNVVVNSSSDTIVYIPLILSDSLQVNGFIRATINDSIALSFSLSKDYKAYSFSNKDSLLKSDEYALLIMKLNNIVFGYKKFLITDNRLFSNGIIDTISSINKHKTLLFHDRVSQNIAFNNVAAPGVVCQDYSITLCDEYMPAIQLNINNSNITNPCHTWEWTECWTNWDDGGTTNPLPNGGGGGGSGGIPYYYPCNPNISNPDIVPGDPLPACPPPGPGTGWVPTIIYDVISNPNEPSYPDISDNEPQVSLQSLFNCFNQIPNTGATYSVKLCVDLPVNGIWNASFNLTHKSPGHTFLTLTKANGSQSISQTVGFYPIGSGGTPWNPITTGGFKNNGLPNHEYNAAVNVTGISDTQFSMVINNLLSHENDTYNIFNNNCTTRALEAFNLLLVPPITVELFNVYIPPTPGAPYPIDYTFSESPQKLYKAIESFTSATPQITKEFNVNNDSPLSINVCL